jgi:transposase
LAENAIRPFVVSRKNWLLFGYPGGAQTSADFYSLIETAKVNGLNLYFIYATCSINCRWQRPLPT